MGVRPVSSAARLRPATGAHTEWFRKRVPVWRRRSMLGVRTSVLPQQPRIHEGRPSTRMSRILGCSPAGFLAARAGSARLPKKKWRRERVMGEIQVYAQPLLRGAVIGENEPRLTIRRENLGHTELSVDSRKPHGRAPGSEKVVQLRRVRRAVARSSARQIVNQAER